MPSSASALTAEQVGVPNEAAAYLASLQDDTIVERVRVQINDAHVFKLPSKAPTSSGGWRGADWTDEVWQGTLKVVERDTLTCVLLVDRKTKPDGSDNIFAVCPVQPGAIDRCVDSSRYFVLRVENATSGRHMYIGLAFNERNDAFDFNTSLEDSARERALEEQLEQQDGGNPMEYGPSKDYSIKDGEKIHISVSKVAGKKPAAAAGRRASMDGGSAGAAAHGGFALKASKKDTPRRMSATGTTFASG